MSLGMQRWTGQGPWSVYEGVFVDGDFNGQGKMNYLDGSIYEGEWKDGKSTKESLVGRVYEGEWKDGARWTGVLYHPVDQEGIPKIETYKEGQVLEAKSCVQI